MARLMKGVGQLLDYTFNSLDMSSGANDVLVIEQPDGTLQSTPFNVRFGKLQIVRSREKIVHLEINGKTTTEVYMKIGEAGEAYWLLPSTTKVASELMSSPLPSPDESPITSPSAQPAVAPERAPPISLFTAGLLDEATAPMSPKSLQEEEKRLAQGLSLTDLHETLLVAAAGANQEVRRTEESQKEEGSSGGDELRLGGNFASNKKIVPLSPEMPPTSLPNILTPPSASKSPRKAEPIPKTTLEGEDNEEEDEEDNDETQYWVISALPSHEQLAKLKLRRGMNTVKFVTHSTLRGRQEIPARIYFWNCHAQIVVSDVDGTVTKSDVLGHILPRIGKDWTHDGICPFYKRISDNGYKILYLTARSIGQLAATRQFLKDINQNGVQLPDGPVIGAPDRIFTALTREVITRTPYEFKIACLKSMLKAFPRGARPFYAGMGNRIGDVISYTAVGIPNHKVLIIDVQSQVHICNVNTTYKNLSDLVNEGFPPVPDDPSKEAPQQEFNAFNYWYLDVKGYFPPEDDATCPFVSDDEVYYLRQLKVDKVMTVHGGNTAVRTLMELTDAVTPPKEVHLWTFEKKKVTDGPTQKTYYNVRNVLTKKGLNVRSGSLDSGAKIWQYDNYDSMHTQWKIVVVNRALNTIRLVNRNSGRCVMVDSAGAVVQGPKESEARSDDFSITWQIGHVPTQFAVNLRKASPPPQQHSPEKK